MSAWHVMLCLVVRECVAGPISRAGGELLTYRGDIADMKNIRRKGRVVNFLEGVEAAGPELNASQLVSSMYYSIAALLCPS